MAALDEMMIWDGLSREYHKLFIIIIIKLLRRF